VSQSTLPDLVIAISSRALFDLDEAHQVFEQQGLTAYSEYQVANEQVPLEPGTAFGVVRKLLALNDQLRDGLRLEVVLLSRNSADTGLRVFNSIEHYDLAITRAAFCGGEAPWRYISAFGCQLFLSAGPEGVRKALENTVAAATLVSRASKDNDESNCVLLLTAMPYCSPTKPSRCTSVMAWKPSRPASRPAVMSPSREDPLSVFSGPCRHCNKLFQPTRLPSEPRWSRRDRHRPMSGSSARCAPGTFASMSRFF